MTEIREPSTCATQLKKSMAPNAFSPTRISGTMQDFDHVYGHPLAVGTQIQLIE